MLDYVMLGLGSVVAGWLVHQQLRLSRQVIALEEAVAKCQPARSGALKESAGQLIEELKAVADSACSEVMRALEQLRAAQREIEDGTTSTVSGRGKGEGVPVALILQLADEGLAPSHIARQVGAGLAEVDLVLRMQRGNAKLGTTVRPMRMARQREGGEVAVA